MLTQSGYYYHVGPEAAVCVGPEGVGEAVLRGVGRVFDVLQEAPAISCHITPANHVKHFR